MILVADLLAPTGPKLKKVTLSDCKRTKTMKYGKMQKYRIGTAFKRISKAAHFPKQNLTIFLLVIIDYFIK